MVVADQIAYARMFLESSSDPESLDFARVIVEMGERLIAAERVCAGVQGLEDAGDFAESFPRSDLLELLDA